VKPLNIFSAENLDGRIDVYGHELRPGARSMTTRKGAGRQGPLPELRISDGWSGEGDRGLSRTTGRSIVAVSRR
jgi:hypothetical protein